MPPGMQRAETAGDRPLRVPWRQAQSLGAQPRGHASSRQVLGASQEGLS